jgi:hypothetical protein
MLEEIRYVPIEKGKKVFMGTAEIYELPYLTKSSISGRPEANDKAPVLIQVRDNNEFYGLMFFQNDDNTLHSIEREKNILEILEAWNKGRRISVTGMIRERETLEEALRNGRIYKRVIDSTIITGMITIGSWINSQEYMFYIDYANHLVKNTTRLAKSERVVWKM